MAREARSGGLNLPTRKPLGDGEVPDRRPCEERADNDDLLRSIRPAYEKFIFSYSLGTSDLGAHPKHGPRIHDHWVQWRKGYGTDTDEEAISFIGLCYVVDTWTSNVMAYGIQGHWYPMLCLDMEIKKLPPLEKGWPALFFRAEMKMVRHGRYDFDMTVIDKEGDIVALRKHTALIVDARRITKGIAKI